MSKYEIYCKMFDYTDIIEDCVRESLINNNTKIFTCEVFVGNEDNKQFEIYIEFSHPRTGYQFVRGLYTVEQINKKFRTNLKGQF